MLLNSADILDQEPERCERPLKLMMLSKNEPSGVTGEELFGGLVYAICRWLDTTKQETFHDRLIFGGVWFCGISAHWFAGQVGWSELMSIRAGSIPRRSPLTESCATRPFPDPHPSSGMSGTTSRTC